MRYLESERLLIKPVEEEDIIKLLEWRWDRNIMAHLVHEPISKQQQLAWFRGLTKKDLALSIFLKGKQGLELVGTVGLYDIDRRHQLATWRLRLSTAVQKQGIGYEATSLLAEYAFNTLNLRKICSTSFAGNEAILKLSHKLGFKEEGRLRAHFFNNGTFQDVIVFGLLEDDFVAARKTR
jgi:RimJ/RimL family protein N-acetyltransferase